MLRRVVLLAVVSLLASSTPFARSGMGGDGTPTSIVIQQFPAWNKVPIVITAAKIRGQEVGAGIPFDAGDEWIRQLSVVVKNVSAVELAGVSVTVEFAKSADGEPWLPNLEMSAGTDYQFVKDPSDKAWALKPEESVELSVSAAWYSALEYELKHRVGIPSGILHRATITPLMASFTRDRVWLRGNYMMRDAENSDRWKPEPVERSIVPSRALRTSPFRLVTAGYRRLPGCYRWKNSEVVHCTGTGCTDCDVIPDQLMEPETGGWKTKLEALQRKRLVGVDLVPCKGCTKTFQMIDYFQSCW